MVQDLRPLTTLRFFAASWVVLFHYWPDLTRLTMPAFVAKGYLGVELFFVLSGFILSHVYLQGVVERRFDYRGFLWARIARVYPLHLATLAVIAIMATGQGMLGMNSSNSVLVWSSLPAQLTMTHAWGLALDGGWNHPSWSISAEWFAYLLFPLFAMLAVMLRSRPRAAIVAAIALIFAMYAVAPMVIGGPLTRATIAWGALRIVPCFAYGCAAYLLWKSEVIRRQAWAILGAAISVGMIVLSGQSAAPDAFTVTAFGGLIVCLACLTSSGSRLLSGRVGVYLGEVSYAVYMVSLPWQLLFVKGAHKLLHLPDGPLPMALGLALMVGVIPAAMIAHHLVERPARTALRAWRWPLRWRKPVPAEVVAA